MQHHRHPSSKNSKSEHRHETSIATTPWLPGMNWRTTALVAAAIITLTVWLYGWTADFPLVFDDLIYLKDNPLLTDSRSFGFASRFYEFANLPGKLGLDPDLATNFILRPVAYLTFHINYVFGEFTPRWYRLGNMAIHMGNAVLLYLLLGLLLRHGNQTATQTLHRRSITFIAAATAIWFAVHPLATESVTFVVQRFTSLATFFYLLTLLIYLAAQGLADRKWRWLMTGGAVFTLLLGMLTKESSFTLPVMAVLLDWLVRRTRLRTAVARALPLLVCLPLIPALLLLVTWAQNSGTLTLGDAFNIANHKTHPIPLWSYAVTQLTVVTGYLRLLVWPVGLNVDHDWPLYRSLQEPAVLGALGVIALLLSSTWWWMRRCAGDPRAVLAFVSVLWFFATISISSSVFPLPDLMAEHRCYLPSIGFFVLAACLFDAMQTWRPLARESRLIAPGMAAIITLLLCMSTLQRNEVWSSRICLWEDAAKKSPGKHRVWGNLGASYAEAERYKDSERCYLKAREVNPQFLLAYMHLGTLALVRNDPNDAYAISMEAIQNIPEAKEAVPIQYNIGISLLGLGRLDDGAGLLKEIVRHIPDHRDSHYALGKYYWHQKRYVDALKHWRVAAMLKAPNQDLPELITLAEARMQR